MPGPRREDARFYDPPTIAWSVRTTDPHLHPGGEEATVLLAQRAATHGFPSGGRVLDLGSGLGAPGRFVARRFASEVVSIDIESASLRAARDMAAAEGLDGRCSVLLGTGEALPFEDGVFDAAWSQDVICHMRKQPAIEEVARVLRAGAIFAFSDWIARTPLSDAERRDLAASWSFPSLLRVAEYAALLEASGLELLLAEDVTYLRRAGGGVVLSDRGAWEVEFARRHGGHEFARQEARVASWVALLDAGRTGNGLFVARRRPASA